MRKIRLLFFCLCCAAIVPIMAAEPGKTCESAISLDSCAWSYYESQTVWYSTWLFNLPVEIVFTPFESNESVRVPEVEMDFSCTPGVYSDSIICSLFCKGSGTLQISMPIRERVDTVLTINDGKISYHLVFGKTYRDFLLSAGIDYNVKVFFKVTYHSKGITRLCSSNSSDKLFLSYDATSLTDEQRASNPDRLAYPTAMKETVKTEVNFECSGLKELSLGPFSVSDTKKVMFSPGNLQYNAAKGTHACADGTTQPGTWRFAENQWDFVGNDTYGTVYENGVKCSNTLRSSTYNGWIDLFGWGTSGWNSGANEYQPYSTSTTVTDYYPGGSPNTDLTGAYAYADWGVYNAINNGSTTDPTGTWRTLTESELEYLFHKRTNSEALFGLGTIDDVPGIIILPDNWSSSPSGITFTSAYSKGITWVDFGYNMNKHYKGDIKYTDNIYTKSQWRKLEAAGAVFIPANGHCGGSNTDDRCGDYWTASLASSSVYYFLISGSFFSGYGMVAPGARGGNSNRNGVRLVRDNQ